MGVSGGFYVGKLLVVIRGGVVNQVKDLGVYYVL